MKKYRIFLFFCLSYVATAQETVKNIDSLLTLLEQTSIDTTKVVLYQKAAAHYNVTALDSSKAFSLEGIQLARKLNFPRGEWMNLSTLGNYYERKTKYDSAMVCYHQALKIIDKTNSDKGRAIVYNNIGMVDIRKGDYQKALEALFLALRAEEKLNNRTGIAQSYNNIGVAHYYLTDYDKATEYLLKALEEQKKLGNISGLQQGYNNVGAIFDYQGKYLEAIEIYTKALDISRSLGDRILESSNLANIALAYSKIPDFKKADDFFQQSIAVRKAIGDTKGLAHSYTSFGENLRLQKRYILAKQYLVEGLQYAEENKLKLSSKEAYSSLAALAKDEKNPFLEAEYLRKYIAINDSILNETKAKAIEELETKYETEKKENEILQQRAQLAEKDLEVRQKNTLIYGGFGLALILGLLGYLFYNQQKLKNRQLKKEGELQTALSKIEIQNKLQEQRLRISRDLHDNIGSQLTFVTSSIDNLKYALEGSNEKVTQKLGAISEFTTQTIYELRDTIWAMNTIKITSEDLQVRIANFIEKAGKATEDISFNFSVGEGISEKTYTSIQGMSMYRIIQESINNSLKYAHAKNISVRIERTSEILQKDVSPVSLQQIKIEIKDDGVGFDEKNVEAGNGLSNIRKRARDMGGIATITSEVGKGTRTQILF
ncbi:tetratricopeptide repeat-containing sensor histidine kinase [Rasiella sp. SM2506]|uniref:tetratricopeptide repeat-containing sensor histidine kinase n=1 Tax=Rasiella sp. SM2506 TaxID=3423914 RepID=UPI003D7ABF2C